MTVSETPRKRFRIGVDVGGTFTDLVLADLGSGALCFYKEPTTPADPAIGVERGIAGCLDRARATAAEVELVVHGTTLGLNTIIQRRGARVALVVSPGNRDLLEIARCRMPSSYDLSVGKEEPLVPRDLVFELPARTRADGTIEQRPNAGDIEACAQALRQKEVAAVAVMLLHSYIHPELEREVAAALRRAAPGILVTESAALWPEVREYERGLVATMNAYIHPLIDTYLSRLQARLSGLGIGAPIYITASNGGTLGLTSARERPIDTVLSGPASGVVAGAKLAQMSQLKQMITVDMGGTSSDMAISVGGHAEYTSRTTIGDFPLILPVVNVAAIGAGGGSIIWVDPQGVMKIGPHSAGADPGPVCYGRGGLEPTITDAYLSLGLLRVDGFLGGRMQLDRAAAIAALEGVARRVGLDSEDGAARAAEAALRVATAKMATELHKSFAQRGIDPRPFVLIAYGGAGPTQANLLAEEVGLASILIPPSPGTLCALGGVLTDLKRDYVRTVRRRINTGDLPEHVLGLTAQIREESNRWLQSEGDIVGPTQVHWSADLRYAGQAYDLPVPVSEAVMARADLADISERFHCVHESIYGFRDTDSAIELIALRAQVVGTVPPITLQTIPSATAPATPHGRRRVFHSGTWIDVMVYQRSELLAGHALLGPALVEQEDTTVWVLPGWSAVTDSYGNCRIHKT